MARWPRMQWSVSPTNRVFWDAMLWPDGRECNEARRPLTVYSEVRHAELCVRVVRVVGGPVEVGHHVRVFARRVLDPRIGRVHVLDRGQDRLSQIFLQTEVLFQICYLFFFSLSLYPSLSLSQYYLFLDYLHLQVCVCVCVCVCVYMYIYIYIYIYIHTHTHIYIHTHTHTHTHRQMEREREREIEIFKAYLLIILLRCQKYFNLKKKKQLLTETGIDLWLLTTLGAYVCASMAPLNIVDKTMNKHSHLPFPCCISSFSFCEATVGSLGEQAPWISRWWTPDVSSYTGEPGRWSSYVEFVSTGG